LNRRKLFLNPIYKYCLFYFQLLLFSIGLAANAQTKFIPFNNPNIRYEGRIEKQKDAAEFYWSGTSVTIFFKGTNIATILKDTDTANYYNVIIDDKNIIKIHTDTVKKSYQLVTGLLNKKHKIQLFKRTEWFMGKTLLYGFETSPNTKIFKALHYQKEKLNFMVILLPVDMG
jgi:hypothetical protein